jgi:hypothetical protein
MKLAISTLLASIALLSPQALAMGEDSALDLQYAVRDGEALYSVATANGDLRFVNQGPSAAKLRWFDPLRGEEETRVLHPGQSLVSQGHFGVSISEGTVVLVEKIGPGPIASGIASIPTDPLFRGCIPTDPCQLESQQGEANQMHDSIHCLHNNGAFLPWHRGYFAPVDTLVGGTMCSIESYRGILGVISSSLSEYKFLLGDGSVRFIGVPPEPELEHGPGMHDSVHCIVGMPTHLTDTERGYIVIAFPGETQNQCQGACYLYPEASSAIWTQTLEHGPGMHDSVHCIVGGTMCSASTSGTQIYFTHHANIDWLWGQVIANGLEHGPGMHDSILVLQGETQNQCQGACYIVSEPAGQVYTAQGQSNESIWGAGPINSYWDWTMEPTTLDSWTVNKLIAIIAIAPDGTVVTILGKHTPFGTVDL